MEPLRLPSEEEIGAAYSGFTGHIAPECALKLISIYKDDD
jgi:hypothetical protein